MFDDFEVLARGCQRGTNVEQRVPKWDFGGMILTYINAVRQCVLAV